MEMNFCSREAARGGYPTSAGSEVIFRYLVSINTWYTPWGPSAINQCFPRTHVLRFSRRLMSLTLNSAVQANNTTGGHGTGNMVQRDEQKASPSNYKGFVAGIFSGIGKLAGELIGI
jgi:hypothetical protein